MKKTLLVRPALEIAGLYGVIAWLWDAYVEQPLTILGLDRYLSAQERALQQWAFSLFTALLLYVLLRRALLARDRANARSQASSDTAARLREAGEQLAAANATLAGARADAERRADELDAVFGALVNPVFIYDPEGRVVRMNPAAAANYSLDSFDGLDDARRQFALRTSGGEPPAEEAMPAARALRGETVPGEQFQVTDSGGRERFFLVSAAPILVNGRVAGAVVASHDLTEREQLLRQVQTYADNLRSANSRLEEQAVALQAQNAELAHLYSQAQRLAVLEERQRLARELHDSVSQTLYSIALGARTARALVEIDPKRAGEPLDYVLSLADAGMTEMRALIFELRPESLEREGLVGALGRQAALVRSRYGIEVRVDACPEPDLPFAVKEAFYRIAQEALHNTAKHSRAASVDVSLWCGDHGMVLEVRDDGAGFEPGGPFPGHLGLQTMRERAVALGGTLEILSREGEGTTVRACLPT